MQNKPRTLLYGGGDYCTKFLSDRIRDSYDLMYIVDRNQEMWGKAISNIPITSPEILLNNDYDLVIVTPGKWESIVSIINTTYKVSIEKISLYEVMNHRVVNLKDDEVYISQQQIEKQKAIITIKENLVKEAAASGVFDRFTSIYIVGSEQDYEFVNQYISVSLKIDIDVQWEPEVIEKDTMPLWVFTGREYLGDMERIRQSNILNDNWLLIPLFDVDNSILG